MDSSVRKAATKVVSREDASSDAQNSNIYTRRSEPPRPKGRGFLSDAQAMAQPMAYEDQGVFASP